MDDESGIVRLVDEFAKRYGIGAALIGALFFLLIWRFDMLRKVFADRANARREERAQAWEMQDDIIKNLREENEILRHSLAEEREQNARLVRLIESSEAGNSRLRHMINNTFTWASSLTLKLRRANIPFEQLDLSDLMERDPDYGKKLNDILAGK